MNFDSELFAAVVARPDDDLPRRVLADALSDEGDPQGELIVLQLERARGNDTKAGRARETKLLAQHRERFLDGLAQVVRPVGQQFERGFLSRAKLQQALPAHPLSRLLEEVQFTAEGVEGNAQLDALKAARGIPLEQVQTLFAQAPRLERLELTRFEALPAVRGALGVLPKLRELTLRVGGPVELVVPALAGEPLFQVLVDLTVTAPRQAVNAKALTAALQKLPPVLQRLRLHHEEGEHWLLARKGSSWVLEAHVARQGQLLGTELEVLRVLSSALPLEQLRLMSQHDVRKSLERAAPELRGRFEWSRG